MRNVITILLACLVAACATTDFQPYEGKAKVFEGEGGTKVSVDGVDFWSNGAPPRKYSIIGMVVSETGAGYGDEAVIRSAVAREVLNRGGHAAVQVTNNTSCSGVLQTAPGFFAAMNTKRMQFAVVKYE